MAIEMAADLLRWLREDLSAAKEWHAKLMGEMVHSENLTAYEQGKIDMVNAIFGRLDAYERGEDPIKPKGETQ